MISVLVEPTASRDVLACVVERDGVRMTFAEVFDAFAQGTELTEAWSKAIAALPFTAFCFETPALTRARLSHPFECVFVESPSLARSRADSEPFEEHFVAGRASVVFASLRGDALLVAPCPEAGADLTHLATFARTASRGCVVSVWRDVARALTTRISDTPLWLSTAGLGVSWLHVRLDSTPKYYRHAPYRRA